MSPRKLNQLTGFLIALLLLGTGFIIGTSVLTLTAQQQFVSLNTSTVAVPLSDSEKIFADVYARVSPSVVALNVTSRSGGGSGSGFVIDTQGRIVTNYHVIEGARDIEVNFHDGTMARAQVIGEDIESDLAVIQVSDVAAEKLMPITFGSSDELIVGQQVLAIGSPFGQRWTMTAGIVSALDRAISGFTEFSIGGVIQTDAPINPGNSGGPLLNLAGEVIGVNSQINTTTGANSGIGFAVPSNLVVRVARELVENGRVNYSYLGISGSPLSLQLSEALNLPNDVRGAVIRQVVDGGPAAQAGLRSARVVNNTIDWSTADIITAVNGVQVYGMDTIISYLAKNTAPNDVINLTVIRGGQTINVAVTLGARPTQAVQPQP